MKNKYIKIFLFAVLAVLFIAFFYQYSKKVINSESVVNTTPKIEAPKLVPRKTESSKKVTSKISEVKEIIPEVDTNKISIKIIVEDKVYESRASEGVSIYQSMVYLSTQNKNFTFTSKDYSGMGMFVDSINGVQGNEGKYWVYYLNDKKASVGISKNFLKEGDTVRWEREGFIN